MSCSLCRLPFTPSDRSVAPRWPPPGVLTQKQVLHMKYAVGMGKYVAGLVIDLVNLDNNMFVVDNSPMMVNIAWEFDDKTFIALHKHCATILRHHLGFLDNSPYNLIELSLLERIVGPTMGGLRAGRLSDIDYEGVLGQGAEQRVDIESLWSKEGDKRPEFNWLEWQRRGLEWTAVQPDVFPRFRPQVAPKRTSVLLPLPTSNKDVITTLPLDIMHDLLPYLDPKSFFSLLSTCRTLRYHALTTFQSQARAQVLKLEWALPTEVDYVNFVRRNPPPPASRAGDKKGDFASAKKPASTDTPDLSLVAMAHARHSPIYGDWYLYLSQVLRSPAMRSRRWVWALAEELTRVYRAKRAAGPYEDVVYVDGKRAKSSAWIEYAKTVQVPLAMRAQILAPYGPNGKAMSW